MFVSAFAFVSPFGLAVLRFLSLLRICRCTVADLGLNRAVCVSRALRLLVALAGLRRREVFGFGGAFLRVVGAASFHCTATSCWCFGSHALFHFFLFCALSISCWNVAVGGGIEEQIRYPDHIYHKHE